MTQPLNPEPVASLIEVAGLVMVSGLLLPMTRVVPGHFLRYWVYAWGAIAAAVVLGVAATRVPALYRPSFLVGYCLGEYLFGFLVWAGCHEFATGQGFRSRHAALFVPFAAAAVCLPLMLGLNSALAVPHGLLMGGVTLFAFAATFRRGLRSLAPTLGLLAIRLALFGLAVLYLREAVLHGPGAGPFAELLLAGGEHFSLVRVLFLATLGFGMMVLAADRMREELEAKNQQLAVATAELSSAARTDALTGLGNRRAFDELAAHCGDAESLAGALAVIDMNDLKLVNDRHGHVAGDAAIRTLARALRNQFRVTDPMFRTGGDEFVVVLAGGSSAELAGRMAQLETSLRGVRLPGAGGSTDLSVSWGVAEFAGCGELAAACQKADNRMYADKRTRKQESGSLSRAESALD